MNPIQWSEAAVAKLGWLGAFLIAREYKRPTFGEVPNVERNLSAEFYRNAYAWMRKRLPEDVVNRLAHQGVKV